MRENAYSDPRFLRQGGKPVVLLFYDGFEMKSLPGASGRLYSDLRRAARYTYRSLRRRQVWTGFYTAFRGLWDGLRAQGCAVRVNDFALAKRHPDYPIGVAGFPSVLPRVDGLANPRIFGPGDFGNRARAAEVARDPRFRRLIQPSDWYAEYFRAACGDKMMVWASPLDLRSWPDLSAAPKSLDVVVYDKLRWHRETEVPRVLDRVTRHLDARGLRHKVLRYGHHHRSEFAAALRDARCMIFLCEHETQGLAYQEALACNVPVLAWDEGVLVDPNERAFDWSGLDISSVPYFDERCGMRFKIADYENSFDAFWPKLGSFAPRDYVRENLSQEFWAKVYLSHYAELLPG